MNTLWMIVQRISYALILLLAVLVLNFALMYLAPGDIADTIAGVITIALFIVMVTNRHH